MDSPAGGLCTKRQLKQALAGSEKPFISWKLPHGKERLQGRGLLNIYMPDFQWDRRDMLLNLVIGDWQTSDCGSVQQEAPVYLTEK
jgi:hypothetical protein